MPRPFDRDYRENVFFGVSESRRLFLTFGKMKIVRIPDYLLIAFIMGLFWLVSYRADAQLQAMFEKPDPTLEHRTLASATEEIAYLKATQSDLLSLHHLAHVRTS